MLWFDCFSSHSITLLHTICIPLKMSTEFVVAFSSPFIPWLPTNLNVCSFPLHNTPQTGTIRFIISASAYCCKSSLSTLNVTCGTLQIPITCSVAVITRNGNEKTKIDLMIWNIKALTMNTNISVSAFSLLLLL